MMSSVLQAKLSAPNASYSFASLPRALFVQRRRIRDYSKTDSDRTDKMHRSMTNDDRGRSVPWATWTSTIISDNSDHFRSNVNRKSPPTRLALSRQQERLRRSKTSSVAPVPGRKHLQVQTESYLEELTDAIDESDATCQTEELEDKWQPLPITFVAAKTGIDVGTQIEDDELFDFDMESHPILEVLVGKALQNAVFEVLQEEDLANILRQQCRYRQLRKACLEGETEWKRQQQEKEGHQAAIHSWGFTTDLLDRDLERAFLPWILDEVEDELKRTSTPQNGSITPRSTTGSSK